MAMVTGIRDARGIVEVSLDGVVFAKIRKKHFEMCPLSVGDGIAPEEYLDAVAARQFADAYEAALTALDFSARTGAEIEKALARRGYVAPAARAVVERLAEARIIDDAALAARIAEGAAKKSVGVYAVRRKLMAKGLNGEDAERALESLDGEQQTRAAREAAEKLRRKYEGLPPREARAKLSQALARRGFSWETISGALEDLNDAD